MQQELIEMLDKMVKYFDEISSDSYYYRETAAILNEAERLVEKAKSSTKEPAVPRGEPLHRCTNCQAIYQDPPPTQCDCMPEEQEYESGFASFPSTPAPSQEPVTLTDAVKALDDLQSAFMSHTQWNGTPPSEVIAARAIVRAAAEIGKATHDS